MMAVGVDFTLHFVRKSFVLSLDSLSNVFFTQILTTVVKIPIPIARPFAAKGFATATDALGSHVASTGGHLPLQAFSDEENMMKETGR